MIRNALEIDLPAIVDIYNATILLRNVTPDFELVTVASRLDWFRSHTPDRPLWVFERDATILGWIGLKSFRPKPAYLKTVELSIYVAEAARRQGVGSQLLQTAIDRSPAMGIATLMGFVFTNNQPSLTLFQRHGFEQWGYLPKIIRFEDREQDVAILGRQLESVYPFAPSRSHQIAALA